MESVLIHEVRRKHDQTPVHGEDCSLHFNYKLNRALKGLSNKTSEIINEKLTSHDNNMSFEEAMIVKDLQEAIKHLAVLSEVFYAFSEDRGHYTQTNFLMDLRDLQLSYQHGPYFAQYGSEIASDMIAYIDRLIELFKSLLKEKDYAAIVVERTKELIRNAKAKWKDEYDN